jgi:20S proteasome subunit alpha 7
MAAIGAGYDLSVSTFSPDGRIFQVEYASKAVDSGNTSVGIVCKDGILFAAEKFLPNKMTVPGTSPRIFAVDRHVTIAVGGFIADAREIVYRARLEAKEYRRVYDEPIPAQVLSERLALFLHAYTLAWSERPFGAAIILGVCEEGSDSFDYNENGDLEEKNQKKQPKFSLYSIDAAGACYKFFGVAIGKGRQIVKTEIEKLDRQNMTCEECLIPVATLMRRAHDDTKIRDVELEMAWICFSSNFEHAMVPRSKVQEAIQEANASIENQDIEIQSVGHSVAEDVDMA